VLKYTSDAVLPVYILHQTIIVTLGYWVIQWDAGVAAKYFLIVLATLAISLAVYEIVRRINVTRFLFGIKTKKPASMPTPAIENAPAP
jgi:glucans biosynthesis protein C